MESLRGSVDCVIIYHEDEDSFDVAVCGTCVITASHDDDGWSGMARIRDAFIKTARVTGGTYREVGRPIV